jgi:hypothetical protein
LTAQGKEVNWTWARCQYNGEDQVDCPGVDTVADAETHSKSSWKATLSEEEETLEVAKAKVVRLQAQLTETEEAAENLGTRNAKGYLVKEAEKNAAEITKLKAEHDTLAWPRAALARKEGKLAARNKILSNADSVLAADVAGLTKEQVRVTGLLELEQRIAAAIEQEQLRKLAKNKAEATSNGLIIHKLSQADAALAAETALTKRVAQQAELEELRKAVAASDEELRSIPAPMSTTTTVTVTYAHDIRMADEEGTDPSSPETLGEFPHSPSRSNQMSSPNYVPPSTTTTVTTAKVAFSPAAAPAASPVYTVAAPAPAPALSPASSPSSSTIY